MTQLADHPTVKTVRSRAKRRRETLYVLPNSRALTHAERRYPHKTVRIVDSGIRGR